jgi:L-rhamnose isomerase
MGMNDNHVEEMFRLAKEQYGEMGVDVEQAMERLQQIPISLHCWQGDDVGGFENAGDEIGGGLAVTGNYPGKARTADELRADVEKVYSLLPGKHRFNLHASYAETGGKKVDRNELTAEYFANWIDWAKDLQIGVDFNGTYFAHPKADDGFTLSHADDRIRSFWIEHGKISRQIGAAFGKALGTPCVVNQWIPDGYKDVPVDRNAPRERLRDSLDQIFAEKMDPAHQLDAVECKLFGIGSESYVVGSHEFYLGYAITNNTLLCLDTGHFHPTENVYDKLSSVMMYVDEILLHVSRGIRWDSDHVVIWSDELQMLANELARLNRFDKVHIGLDFFDASINRIAAWTIGTRCMLKSLLMALLEPTDTLRQAENEGDFTSRLAMLEELKSMPFGPVWDYYCLQSNVPVGRSWLDAVNQYEIDVLSKR